MDIATVLSSAAKLKATDVRVVVGEPTQMIVNGVVRTLFGSTVKAEEFEAGITQRLDVFAREQIRSTGRYHGQFEEKGIGTIRAEFGSTNARFLLPEVPEARPAERNSSKDAPGETKPGLFEKLFGRK
jgi:Tfp pilus assembly pilus retraction ATPase PilT